MKTEQIVKLMTYEYMNKIKTVAHSQMFHLQSHSQYQHKYIKLVIDSQN